MTIWTRKGRIFCYGTVTFSTTSNTVTLNGRWHGEKEGKMITVPVSDIITIEA